jgi:hypothetical protein
MTVIELATYHVLEDPASPILTGGIRCGVRNILRVRFWWDIASVSSLATVVLRDPALGLHWD